MVPHGLDRAPPLPEPAESRIAGKPRPEPGGWERHSTFEFNQHDENAQELGEMYKDVVKAADAYRQLLAG